MKLNDYYSTENAVDKGVTTPQLDVNDAIDPFDTSMDEPLGMPIDDEAMDRYFEQLAEQEEAYQSELQRDYTADNAPNTPADSQPDDKSFSNAVQAELDRKYEETMRQIIEPNLINAMDSIPELQPVLKRGDAMLCSLGNISAVVGEAKSKKTFFCTAMVGSMLDITNKHLFGIEQNRCKVLWIDTEQSPAHIQKVLFRINVLGGLPHNTPDPTLRMLWLREKSPKDRFMALEYGISLYRPKLVVIDGVSDLMSNTNNLEESEELVSKLLMLSSVADCHIMCVLHTNPNSDKARGHLGSTLMRKAETVIFVHKTGDTSIVEPQYCRNMPFERFAFKVEEIPDAEFMDEACVGLGIPVECELPSVENSCEDICVRVLRDEFGGTADKRLLQSKLISLLGVTDNYARVKIFRALERGKLKESEGIVSLAV